MPLTRRAFRSTHIPSHVCGLEYTFSPFASTLMLGLNWTPHSLFPLYCFFLLVVVGAVVVWYAGWISRHNVLLRIYKEGEGRQKHVAREIWYTLCMPVTLSSTRRHSIHVHLEGALHVCCTA